jgi:hypothetical protein
MSSNVLAVGLVLAVAGGQMTAAQRGRGMRFQEMDRDNDGRISRAEWNGSDQSFKVHDWNGDGVLSGDEVRPGARRGRQNRDLDSYARPRVQFDVGPCAVSTASTQPRQPDHSRRWHFDREFPPPTANRDGVISKASSSTKTQSRTTTRRTGLRAST